MVKQVKLSKSALPRAKNASPGATAQPKELDSISDEEGNHYESMDSSDESSDEEDASLPPITSSEVAKERADPQGMALFKNSTGYSDAVKSLSMFVKKTEDENLK